MKRLTSALLAGALAVSTVAATATTAAADKRHQPHFQTYSSGNFGAALAAGAFFGLAFSALSAPRYVPPPYPYAYGYAYPYAYAYPPPPPPVPVYRPYPSAAQIAWCKSYPWYNPATNTWTDQYGVMRPCIVPY